MPDPRATGSRADKFPSGPGDGGNSAPGWMPTSHATPERAASVERMARALCKADGRDPDYLVAPHEYSTTRWEPFPTWEHYKPQAELVVEALDE